jgi:hypothetical protein
MVASASSLLCMNLPLPDPEVERIAAILRSVEGTPGLTQVEALAAGAQISVRSLQQLFSEYGGVSPKWVIRRFRRRATASSPGRRAFSPAGPRPRRRAPAAESPSPAGCAAHWSS